VRELRALIKRVKMAGIVGLGTPARREKVKDDVSQ
jgi:hypothetical protein